MSALLNSKRWQKLVREAVLLRRHTQASERNRLLCMGVQEVTDKELVSAVRCCTSTPKIERCKAECVFFCGGNLSHCISRMGKAVSDCLEALLAENEHLREVTKMVPKWVSVSERLPENEKDVLIAFTRKGLRGDVYRCVGMAFHTDEKTITEAVNRKNKTNYDIYGQKTAKIKCPCCWQGQRWDKGEPYEESTQDARMDSNRLARILFAMPMMDDCNSMANYLIQRGVTFREG